MKRTRIALLLALAFAALPGGVARAELKTKGSGKQRTMVREQFPEEMAKRYDVFSVRCTKCHEMGRPILAVETGLTPISNGVFDDEGIKKYVVKMMRKENSGIGKEDAKEIIVFLQYARGLAKQ